MPKRPPSLSERLRDVWSSATSQPVRSGSGDAAPGSPGDSGSNEFADRLRAAVAARR